MKFRVFYTSTNEDAGKNFAITPDGELMMRALDYVWYPVSSGFHVEWEPESDKLMITVEREEGTGAYTVRDEILHLSRTRGFLADALTDYIYLLMGDYREAVEKKMDGRLEQYKRLLEW